jgi:vacuolar-type H+-ATPase subunit I/STV1
MYIVAIAWLYVTLMMALTEPTVVAGILTFVFYGLLPCALLLWLIGTPQRRRNKLRVMAKQQLDQPDRSDTQSDQ